MSLIPMLFAPCQVVCNCVMPAASLAYLLPTAPPASGSSRSRSQGLEAVHTPVSGSWRQHQFTPLGPDAIGTSQVTGVDCSAMCTKMLVQMKTDDAEGFCIAIVDCSSIMFIADLRL